MTICSLISKANSLPEKYKSQQNFFPLRITDRPKDKFSHLSLITTEKITYPLENSILPDIMTDRKSNILGAQ